MFVFTCILFIVLLCGTSIITLITVWKGHDYRSLFVQLVIVLISLTGGIYAIIQYPDVFSIARVLNDLSPLK